MSVVDAHVDLFGQGAQIIAHGCNTEGVMGGLAGVIAKKWPHVKDSYLLDLELNDFPLGCCRFVCPDVVADVWVANLCTQVTPGADACIHLIRMALVSLRKKSELFNVSSIAMPRIGCGIGGLTYEEVKPVIEEVFGESDIIVKVCYIEENKNLGEV